MNILQRASECVLIKYFLHHYIHLLEAVQLIICAINGKNAWINLYLLHVAPAT